MPVEKIVASEPGVIKSILAEVYTALAQSVIAHKRLKEYGTQNRHSKLMGKVRSHMNYLANVEAFYQLLEDEAAKNEGNEVGQGTTYEIVTNHDSATEVQSEPSINVGS